MKTPRGIGIGLLAAVVAALAAAPAEGVDASSPAILQFFEARWDLVEDRMADVHAAGYGRMWVPPPNRASGVLSVGYDVFDRFSFGAPRDETRYGTDASFRAMIDASHKAGVTMHPDLLWNHNGVGNRTDQNFVNLGGYPGFALTLPGDIDGDFHTPFLDFTQDELRGQLAGLNDIAQEKDYRFVRHPVDPANPQNIPAGTLFNRPDPTNTRFYPDRDLGGVEVFDPRRGQTITLWSFNADDPTAGDPVLENSVELLQRNVRWMLQEYDVDGFRIDAARHFPRDVLNDFDNAAFLAKRTPYLDGSPRHAYSFSETGFDSPGFLQDFIRRDIDNGDLSRVGGNRDALDFRLFNRLKDNLTANGAANNWHGVRGAAMDLNDDGLINGSQGVAFTQSHDEGGSFLENVAHAYTLMLPGEALVYFNAKAIPSDSFPQPGKLDALGGAYGDTITTLVGLRNSHGRGEFRERWIDDAFNPNGFSNFYAYERSRSAIVGLNSRNDSVALRRNGVQTDFAPGTILVELTGNAADPAVDPSGDIPESLVVGPGGQIDLTVPGSGGHGRGYVVYGVAPPEGVLGVTSSGVLPGAPPSTSTNGSARLADVEVISDPTFTVRLDTSPVSVPNPSGPGSVRDPHADADRAMLRIDGGLDLNGNGAVDAVTPGDVAYGFEEFQTTNAPGYVWNGLQNVGSGQGVYEQAVDATQLSEGRHHLTARAFRHRDASTGGDGGPAVFTDFRKTLYVDLLPPESEVTSFAPFASDPGNPNNRDLIVTSRDQTAERVHVFLDLPAATTDEQILAMVDADQGRAGYYDRDKFITGQFGVTSGNHVATIVSIEPTGTTNIQRQAGLFTQTELGLGLGDLNADGSVNNADLIGPVGFETVLYSRNSLFNAAADLTADGLVDTRDLIALPSVVLAAATDPRVPQRLEQVLLRRGDVNDDAQTDAGDLAAIHAGLGGEDWLLDIDVDGLVTPSDARLLVTELARTDPADFNLDGAVDAADYTLWRDAQGGAFTGLGDADFDGDADSDDYGLWRDAFGALREPLELATASNATPEPGSLTLAALVLAAGGAATRRRRA
ncbi:hypothetical protein [Botrimarina sp.]|uniref:hypothetical protein n=1 Tax=Botrimarina sp. TaxID=2795802 RepID=UPI0032EC569B